MQKRFCDLCDTEIAQTERYYDLILNVKTDNHGDEAIDTEYRDFCYSCVKAGKASANLLERYEHRAAVKRSAR